MKFLESFIIINTLSCFTFVKPDDKGINKISSEVDYTGKNELNEFLAKLQRKSGIETRTVNIDEGINSLKTFFESTYSSGENINGVWQITKRGVYKTGFLVNAVVSCEYSEYAYTLIQFLEKLIYVLYSNDIESYRQELLETFITPVKQVIASMILTVVGLLKYSNNHSMRSHEIINILLSWYTYMMHASYVETSEDGKSQIHNIDYIKLVNINAEAYFKIYILDNCQSFNNFNTFKSNVEDEIGGFVEIGDFTEYLNNQLNDIELLLYHEFLNVAYGESHVFVLNPSSYNFSKLKDLISDHTASDTIEVKWNIEQKEELFSIYDKYIKDNPSGIKPLLKFEKILLQTIAQIIMGYVSNELDNLIHDIHFSESVLEREVRNKLATILNRFSQKLYNEGQPKYLINYISIIEADLLKLCNNDKTFEDKVTDIGKYISKLNKLKVDVPTDSNLIKLKQFLEKISEEVICARVHPSITNIYWEKMYYAPAKMSDYIIDFKDLHRTYEVLRDTDETTCNALNVLSNRLRVIETIISECEQLFNKKDLVGLGNCLNNTKSKYVKLLTKVEDIVSSADGVYSFNWKLVLLKIIYNMNNVDTFMYNEKEKVKILQDILVLHRFILEYLILGFTVTCNEMLVEMREGAEERAVQAPFHTQNQYREMQNKLKAINSYYLFFASGHALIADIVVNKIEPGLTLYWDGIAMTLTDVFNMYRLYTRDQLQINFDYFTFLIKWYLSLVCTRLFQICREIMVTDTEGLFPKVLLRTFFTAELELLLKELLKLPWFISMPIDNILGTFIFLLKTYNGVDNRGLLEFMYKLVFELDKLHYMPHSILTDENRTYSVYIDALIETLNAVLYIYQRHRIQLESAATNIGMDLNNTLMFQEWN